MPVVLENGRGGRGESVKDRMAAGVCDTFLLIVPTKRKIRHLERELIDMQQGKAVSDLQLHTLESLALALFPRLWPGKKVVSGATRELLFQEAILSVQETLRYFSPRKGLFPIQKGTFEKVVDVITTLKGSGIFLDVLNGELEFAAADERFKLQDIIQIYDAFEHELERLEATDIPGVMTHLHLGCTQQRFEEAFRGLFPEVTMLFIAGFDEFTEPELGFIRKINTIPEIQVKLIFDFQPGNEGLFGHLEENHKRFVELGFRPVDSSEAQFFVAPVQNSGHRPEDVEELTSHMAQYLFAADTHTSKTGSSSLITLCSAKDRTREVEYVCRKVKQMLLDNPGMDMNRICIAMPQPSPYTPLLREMFATYGVPANITDRYLLGESPVVVSILGLLQVAARGFQRDDLLRIVASPYFTLQPEDGKPFDPANLSSVANKLRITGGYRVWMERLEKEQVRLRKESSTEERRAGLLHELQAVEKARQDVRCVYQLLESFQAELTPSEFRRELLGLMQRTGFALNLLRPIPREPAGSVERDIRAYRKFLEIFEETISLMVYRNGAATRHSLRHYLEYLGLAMAGERYNIQEQFGRGVLVTSIQETRGLQLDVMFILGLVDGEFPSVYKPELFYSIERQKRRAQRYSWEQRYLFYQGITNWSTHLYLTHPEQEDGRELVRSSFIDALLEIAEVDHCSAETELLTSTDLLSEEEFFCSYASGSNPAHINQKIPASSRASLDVIDRAVSVERSRTIDHTRPEYEGNLVRLSAPAKKKLNNVYGKTHSVTHLESYGKCPFQYFARHVMHLSGTGDFDEELGSLEKGSMLHTILFEFFRSRRVRQLPELQVCSDDEFAAARRELLELAEKTLAQLDIPDPFWEFEKELIAGSEGVTGLLEEFLEYERERTITAKPEFFEVAFGLRPQTGSDPDLSVEKPLEFGGVKLRGRIDRVEVDDSGVFNVIDYKTGATIPKPEDIRQGMSLQIPLYLAAVEQLLERKRGRHYVPGAGLYYSLRSPVKLQSAISSKLHKGKVFEDKSRHPRVVESDNELREVMDRAISHIQAFVSGIASGSFPLTLPERVNDVCGICEMKAMCRIQSFNHVNPGSGDSE